jgi:serine/threonine protein kinase
MLNQITSFNSVSLPVSVVRDTDLLQSFVFDNKDQVMSLSKRKIGAVEVPDFIDNTMDILTRFKFNEKDKLGDAGAFGVTYRARYINGGVYALKRINVSIATQRGVDEERMEREAGTLQALPHFNIVRCYNSFLAEDGVYFYIIMELVHGSTLTPYITSNPSHELIFKRLLQMTDGLIHIHCKNILHRDSKPENAMITSGSEDVKIIYFGMARASGDNSSKLTGNVGTSMYMSYEKLNDQPYIGKDEVWAVGCIVLELITQKHLTRPLATQDGQTRDTLLWDAKVCHPFIGHLLTEMVGHKFEHERPSSSEVRLLIGDKKRVPEGPLMIKPSAHPDTRIVKEDIISTPSFPQSTVTAPGSSSGKTQLQIQEVINS